MLYAKATIYLLMALGMDENQAKQLLGLSESYTEDELKRNYRRKLVEFHPDRNKAPDAEAKYKEIRNAYDFLTNQEYEKPTSHQENPFEQEPWKHNYYTPRSEYTDAEWFEYQTDPTRQKQYEQEFQDEQEFAQEEYETNQRDKYENDQEHSYDNSIDIRDRLEESGLSPGRMIAAFGEPVERQLLLLGFNRQDLDRKRYTKKDWLQDEINSAIYRVLNEHHPKSMLWLYKKPNARSEINSLSQYLRIERPISFEVFKALFKDDIMEPRDIRVRTPEEQIEMYREFADRIAHDMLSDEKMNITDVVWRIVPEALNLLLKEVLTKIGDRKKTRRDEGVIYSIEREMKEKR